MNDLQIQLEAETRDVGTKKSLNKLLTTIQRDEGSTSYGKRILIEMYNEIQAKLDTYIQIQEAHSRKSKFFTNYYQPSCNNFTQLIEKYPFIKQTLSHPFDLLPFIIAKEICKSISTQVENKLTTIAKNVLDTLTTSYNLQVELDEVTFASCISIIRLCIETSEYCDITHNSKKTVCVVFKSHIIDHVINMKDSLQPHINYEPMIVPPTPHKSLINGVGGYLTLHSPLLKWIHPDIDYSNFDLTNINKLQSVAYTIDQELLDLYDNLGLLDFNVETDTLDIIKTKQKKARVIKFNARTLDKLEKTLALTQSKLLEAEADEMLSSYGKDTGLQRTLLLINKYKDYDQLFFPLFCDNRGRIYNYCADLSPQGNALARHVLKFNETKEITDIGFNWLLIKLGGLLGFDKHTYDVRISEANKILPAIYNFFEQDDTSMFNNIDITDMYEFVAIILEIYRSTTIDNYKSGYICYVDSCASGNQICSLLTKSSEGARLSNLYNPNPNQTTLTDAYIEVANTLKAQYEVIATESNEDLEQLLNEYMTQQYVDTFKGE